MKKMICILMLLPVFGAQSQKVRTSEIVHQDGITWASGYSWEQLKAKARAENKYIFMDCFTTWCGPCKKMDKEIYPEKEIGTFYNKSFISVKVQMDSTVRDNEEVKKWYEQVRFIKKRYRLEEYPTYLFFDPNGVLVFRETGYKNISDFIKTGQKALEPGNVIYYEQLESYLNGNVNIGKLDSLAIFVKTILGNDSLAKEIAEVYINTLDRHELFTASDILLIRDVIRNKDLANDLAKEFKEKYLDTLDDSKVLTKDIIVFISKFEWLVSSKDRFFKLFYYHPEKANEIVASKSWSDFIVESVIIREELENILIRNGAPVYDCPDWSNLSKTIAKKYPKINADDLVLGYQIGYYKSQKKWQLWASCQDKLIRQSTIKSTDAFWMLNLPAWFAFRKCNDKAVLLTALEWSDLSIKLTMPEPDHQSLDTRANLLYKLGRIKEAIEQEQVAIDIATKLSKKDGVDLAFVNSLVKGYYNTLSKMKRREPTYVEQGAIWTPESLREK